MAARSSHRPWGATLSRALAASAALAVLAGCTHHTGPKLAFKPEGETVVIQNAQSARVRGEFLGLLGESLILMRDARLVRLPLGASTVVEIQGYGVVRASRREKLVLYARYPQGLSEEQWRVLLQRHGQEEFDLIPR